MMGEGDGRTPIEAWLESHFTAAQRQLPLLGPELERRRLAGLQPPQPPAAGTSEQQEDDVDDGGGDGDDGDGGVDEDGELQQRQRTTIEDLPVEVLCAVFAAVEAPRDVLACSATCRAWATILGALRSPTTSPDGTDQESDALWKMLVLTSRRWLRHGRASALVPPPRTSWKQYYRMRCHLERNWRVGTMLVKTIPLSSTVRSFDYRPGGTLTSLSHAGIHFYDVVSGASQGKISVPFSPMCHQQFDPFLLVGGTGSKLHLYHDDGRLLAVYPHPGRIEAEEPETVSSVACNVALGKFVSATLSTAQLWDLTSTQPLWTLPEATKTTVLHYDDQKILTGSQDVTVYDAKSGVKVCALPLAEPTISLACLNSFYTLVSTAHGSLLWDLRMPQSYPELERVVYASDDWLCLSSYDTLLSTGVSAQERLTLWQVHVPGVGGLGTKQVRMDQDRIVVGRGQAIHISSFVHDLSTKQLS
ncbi:uncharacterized protein ACA1_069500 [Acanthamoeba castellanii str. Neff]|uniref:F-box domain-containing protein n=1 Tax=Acanthamoeba castellanii (strain ATCC 30010 / Neff) TaxID=1257118 RepID=L8HFZ0_ACACF|nr:uncharacterized protein ACA1_069500 [Acanthamoeba castellanii str. Neff]ELR23366.1 hypothetical protein ACA1_069500 [Acanthamoeba castellanii str. Neff]